MVTFDPILVNSAALCPFNDVIVKVKAVNVRVHVSLADTAFSLFVEVQSFLLSPPFPKSSYLVSDLCTSQCLSTYQL